MFIIARDNQQNCKCCKKNYKIIIPAVIVAVIAFLATMGAIAAVVLNSIAAVLILETKKKCISAGCNNGCLIVRQPFDRTYCYRGSETDCFTPNMYCINESEWNRYAGTSFSHISGGFF